jgi:hypothetical protein
MAKSRTKRNNRIPKPQIEEVVEATEAASVYIGVWTKLETQRLLKSEPIIVQTNWGFRVGKYSVKNVGNSWHAFNEWGEFVNPFSNKKSAIYWSLLQAMGRLTHSKKLLEQDRWFDKCEQDRLHYTHKRRRAIQQKDFFKVDVCDARLSKNQSLLETAKDDLEKTLNSAKYLKGIWEKPL